jgi:hypothetical protein
MERYCRRPIDEYVTGRVQGSSAIAVEMHATLTPNRRAIVAFQLSVGGKIFSQWKPELIPSSFFPTTRTGWSVSSRGLPVPANILIRPNVATSV